MKHKELNGAWEEPGVIGTRVEIDGDGIIVLWRGGPVLETRFKTAEGPDGIELIPKKTGLSYAGDGAPYAYVTGLLYRDDRIEFTKHFSITGDSTEVLSRTDNSRYGNYDIADDILPELAGKWRDERGFWELTIRGDRAEMNGRTTRIHVLKSRSSYMSGVYILANIDPSRDGLFEFGRFEYDGSVLRTSMMVCDAPSIGLVFRKA